MLRVRAPGRRGRLPRARRTARPGKPGRGAPQPAERSDQGRALQRAGLRRDAEGLRGLLDEPLPLARSIAVACLAREESRGAHQRTDHPARDPGLDGMHTLVSEAETPSFIRWE